MCYFFVMKSDYQIGLLFILNVLRFVANDNVNDCSGISIESLFIHSKTLSSRPHMVFCSRALEDEVFSTSKYWVILFLTSFAENVPTTSEPSSETDVSLF